MGVGVDADRRDVELAAGGAFVKGLDVLQDVFEAHPGRWDQVLRQAVKHEGIIGIRTVTQGKRLHSCGDSSPTFGAGAYFCEVTAYSLAKPSPLVPGSALQNQFQPADSDHLVPTDLRGRLFRKGLAMPASGSFTAASGCG